MTAHHTPPASNRPRVLVGITTHNRSAILGRALESALAQDYPTLAVAVIDDGSSEDLAALRARFTSVRWLRHDRPVGYMESRNELMRTTEADYYVSLDDDAWFLRGDEISLAAARMEQDARLAGIAFDILSPDRPHASPRTDAMPAAIFIGCGHMLRLAAVRAAGFYAPTPGSYGSEEKDLAIRLIDLGWKLERLPGVHVWHDKAWSGRDWFPLHRSGVCNELVMTFRRCPAPEVFFVLALKLASFAWYWLRKPRFLLAGLAGVAAFATHLPGLWRTRHAVRRETFWAVTRGQHS